MFLVLFSALLVFSQTDHVHAQGEGDPIADSNQFPCFNSENYTSGDQFQTNLNLLLSSLVYNGTRDGFFNTSIGAGPNIVYGLVQCRGDMTQDGCQSCLNVATTNITQRCPNRKVATLTYDHCILRYSNTRFFSLVDRYIRDEYNKERVSDAVLGSYNAEMRRLLTNLTSRAALKTNKFELGILEDPISLKRIFGKVQCTRDLSPDGCISCLDSLRSHIADCCDSRVGAKIFSASCYMRFETEAFTVQSAAPTPPPPQGTRNGSSPTLDVNPRNGKSVNVIIAIVVPSVASIFLLGICMFFVRRRTRRNKNKGQTLLKLIPDHDTDINEETIQFDLDVLRMATNDFSDENKLGEGGFGAVYKGELHDGQEIAVKRLSERSRQGLQEFKNEVMLLYKLQHRNLVRLLGFCLAGEEKLLIYEYVANRSLDNYIFEPTQDSFLDWETRYKIIGGIARALVYLHEDSRLRIIHRDLKAGNILLDEEMNAKVADFGLAKLFGVDQTRGNTSIIAGTYGYMAPEYVSQGLFSVKSDVFSFGVLLLEIISGQGVTNFNHSGNSSSLLSHAWNLWREGDALHLVDGTLVGNYSANEALRCIHIALLCVQDNLESRPTMSSVVLMLNSYSLKLDSPQAPAFVYESMLPNPPTNYYQSESSPVIYSEDGLTLPR